MLAQVYFHIDRDIVSGGASHGYIAELLALHGVLRQDLPGSGLTVGSEVWVSVKDCHDDQSVIVEDSVSHCVREAVSRELALDDPVTFVTKGGRPAVRPPGRS